MRFISLKAINLRCFQRLSFEFGPRSHLIYGANGSGKTTFLEALYIASTGKSFLTSRSSDLVLSGSDGLSVTAELGKSESEFGSSVVVVKKYKADTQITLDGLAVTTASALARNLPVLVINSRAPDLLSENPNNRRSLLDRSLFHVKHSYIGSWKDYRYALRQRNELLRRTVKSQASYWEMKLAESGEAINKDRELIVSAINQHLRSHEIPGLSDGDLHFEYSPGWNRELGLARQLHDDWARDAELGYTLAGPHRADLSLWKGGRPISKKLSRGQSKIVVCLVITAIAEFIKTAAVPPVMLIDDLTAELDEKMLSRAMDAIQAVKTQCFYTAIKLSDIRGLLPDDTSMFHVERNDQTTCS